MASYERINQYQDFTIALYKNTNTKDSPMFTHVRGQTIKITGSDTKAFFNYVKGNDLVDSIQFELQSLCQRKDGTKHLTGSMTFPSFVEHFSMFFEQLTSPKPREFFDGWSEFFVSLSGGKIYFDFVDREQDSEAVWD